MDRLRKYRSMRDFRKTPEPAGGKPRRGTLPIFVIQKHRASHLHYDFRLEMAGVLKSWAVPKGPSYDPTVRRLAMMTEDHPYDYASFEGVIPEGNYGAGNVIIWDEGRWELLEDDDPLEALAAGKLTFRMFGKKMFGEWALVKIRGRSSSEKGNEWLLLKHRDELASADVDVTAVAPRSVVSNRLVEEVDSANIWESNRKSARRAPTVAARLARTKAAGGAKRGAKKSGATRERAKNGAAKKTAARAAGKATPARKRRAPASPSRAASAPTRSSRAGSRTKARPTPRRRPR
jgi:bifunctional non-homologous end joining protein LigD